MTAKQALSHSLLVLFLGTVVIGAMLAYGSMSQDSALSVCHSFSECENAALLQDAATLQALSPVELPEHCANSDTCQWVILRESESECTIIIRTWVATNPRSVTSDFEDCNSIPMYVVTEESN